MSNSFLKHFKAKTPSERREFLLRATLNVTHLLGRRSGSEAEDIIHEVFRILLDGPQAGQYSRRADEIDHDAYFDRCLSVRISAERRLNITAVRQLGANGRNGQLDRQLSDPAHNPGDQVSEKDSTCFAKESVRNVAVGAEPGIQEYVERRADHSDETTAELAAGHGITQDNMRQRRKRLQKKLGIIPILPLLLCLGGDFPAMKATVEEVYRVVY